MSDKELRKTVASGIVCGAFKVLFPSTADRIDGIRDIAGAIGKLRDDSLAADSLPRRLEDAVDRIADRLARLERAQFVDLDKAERTLAIDAVLETLRSIEITKESFIRDAVTSARLRASLEPRLNRAMRESLLGDLAKDYGRLFLREACLYVVALVRELPGFDSDVAWETYVMTRTIDTVMERAVTSVILPQFRAGTPAEISQFEADYRTDIKATYQYTELFGVDLPPELTRQPVEIAYITLRVDKGDQKSSTADSLLQGDLNIDAAFEQVASEASGARRGARILLSGAAGSGKTTITQWLAIWLADGGAPEVIDAWRGCIPFVVPLRTLYLRGAKPSYQTLAMAGTSRDNVVPRDWVVERMRSGQAVVLFDGLDELADHDRQRALVWIQQLLEENPAAHFVVTSRPDGLDLRWFKSHSFVRLDLKALEPDEAAVCIERWFSALLGASPPEDRLIYARRRDQLVNDLHSRPTVRDLSTTPLLCAMLCAFYAKSLSDSIPRTRIELYRKVVALLIDLRDRARKVRDPSNSHISYKEKVRLLQAIARYMTESTLSSIRIEPLEHLKQLSEEDNSGIMRAGGATAENIHSRTALDIVGEELDGMIMSGLSAHEALSLLLRRSVVFKRVANNEAQFVHRSIQEFLTARAYAYDGDVPGLLARLDDPDWRRITVFAAGTARSKRVATDMLNGILDLAEGRDERTRDLIIMAAECLGAAIQVDSESAARARSCIRQVLPPRSVDEARTLARLGDEILGWLSWSEGVEIGTAKACVFAAARIGGPVALDILAEYARSGLGPLLIAELLEAWELFEPSEYAERVLAHLPLEQTVLSIRSERLLAALTLVGTARIIELDPICEIADLSFSAEVPELREFDYARGALRSLDGLAPLNKIRRLDLSGNGLLADLGRSDRLANLRELSLSGCVSISALDQIVSIQGLQMLFLDGCIGIGDFEGIRALGELRVLSINDCYVRNLAFGANLANLRTLRAMVNGDGVEDASALRACTQLARLEIRLGSTPRPSLGAWPTSLRTLRLNGHVTADDLARIDECVELQDLSVAGGVNGLTELDLAGLGRLRALRVTDCPEFQDGSGISNCSSLEELDLSRSGLRDTAFALRLRRLRRVRLDGCDALADISALEELPNLTFLSMEGVPGVLSEAVTRLRTRVGNPVVVQHDPYPDPFGGSNVVVAE